MKYKVGDKVRVRDDLVVNETYGKNGFVPSMKKNLGQIATITEIDNNVGNLINICTFRYTDEMLEPILESKDDVVVKPSHYTQGKIEVLDFLEDQKLDFRLSNTIKYVCRHKYKGKPLEDLKKARFYLDRVIKELETKSE